MHLPIVAAALTPEMHDVESALLVDSRQGRGLNDNPGGSRVDLCHRLFGSS